jgi:hypothetical protein
MSMFSFKQFIITNFDKCLKLVIISCFYFILFYFVYVQNFPQTYMM